MATRSVFVGRQHEIDDVTAAFDDALAGRGSLFLLVGGAGIGKTRLADELGRRAAASGFTTYWGRCWEMGGAPVYWPWIQILRELCRDLPREELRASAGAAAETAAQLVPELGGETPSEVAEGDPAQARFRLFDAVTSVLKAASRLRPLVLVLDDLHVSDPSSLAMLHFIARNMQGLRALIVGAYRPEEAQLAAEVGKALGDVAREGTFLPLVPLDRMQIGELAGRLFGRAPDPELVKSIERTTEGNPLFVDELLRLLVQRGDFADVAPAALPVPDTVKEVIRRRLARLPAETRELLGVASVVGRDFAAATLAALVKSGESSAVATTLAPAEATNAVLATEPGAFRFSHVLVGETLYQDMPVARRQALHLQIATLLEARGGDVLAQVAHHRLAALPAGDPTAAAAAARRAADRATAVLAFEDAASMLEGARAGLQRAERLEARENFELRLGAGLAFIRAGQGERGRALCAAAAVDARGMGDGESFARAGLSYGAELMLAQNDHTLIELLTEALHMLPPGPSGMRAQVMARLASAQMPAPDPTGPIQMARDALAMARAVDAEDAVVRTVLYFVGSALADYGDPAERMAVSEELVARARPAREQVQLLRAQARLVFDYLELGEIRKSQLAIDAYEAVAREFRQSRHLWPVPMMRAMYAIAEGRATDAIRLSREARAIVAADPEPFAHAVVAWHEVGQVVLLEQVDEVDRAFVEMERRFQLPTHANIAPAMIRSAQAMVLARFGGDPAEINGALDGLPWDIAFFTREPGPLSAMAEAVAVAGNTKLAARLYDAMAATAYRIGTAGRSGFFCLGPGERSLALLAGTLGRLDEAIDLLDRAVARNERLGFRLFIGDARCWQAHYLATRRQPGDAERTRSCLEEADRYARQVNLPRLALRIENVRASLDASPAPQAASAPAPAAARGRAPEPPAFSLTREGDYWTVTAGAVTARIRHARGLQMLAELVATPRREVHVLALMGSDGEAADGGDGGEVLDKEAIADYRERVEELGAELAEAERWSDTGRLARARAERDAIAAELARGVGLGGRARRVSAAAERARVNVQRRIRSAIKMIGHSLPDVGAYLERTVRTGTFCSYEPF